MPFTLPRPLRPIALAGWMLASGSVLAQAGAVDVHFVDSARYSDVRDTRVARADVEQPLAAHLQGLAGKWLVPQQRLEIDITDIDLAGEIEPGGPRMEPLRVMRSHTWPRIALRYTLRDGSGTALRSAELRLTDMNYLDNARVVSAGDPLRFEKQMLTDWFRREFSGNGTSPSPSPQ